MIGTNDLDGGTIKTLATAIRHSSGSTWYGWACVLARRDIGITEFRHRYLWHYLLEQLVHVGLVSMDDLVRWQEENE